MEGGEHQTLLHAGFGHAGEDVGEIEHDLVVAVVDDGEIGVDRRQIAGHFDLQLAGEVGFCRS